MAGRMKGESGTCYQSCVQDLYAYKTIPTHRTLAPELHENSCKQWFHQINPKYKNKVMIVAKYNTTSYNKKILAQ